MRPIASVLFLLSIAQLSAESGRDAWLRYPPLKDAASVPEVVLKSNRSLVLDSARDELIRGARGLAGSIILERGSNLKPDAYRLRTLNRQTIVTGGNDRGVLYGAFALLRKIALGESIAKLDEVQTPAASIRYVNQWDNLNGTIERGYAGPSIFWEKDHARQDLTRVAEYARLLASLGIQGVTINNVNTDRRVITAEYLPEVARIAAAMRPWGVQAALAVDFGSPKTLGNLDTFDPLDPKVAAWWEAKVNEIYAAVPDLGGLIIKADSEGRVGPSAYGRTHADAANVVARPLQARGGLLFYRGFVYNKRMDWRNLKNDRGRAAYDNFHDLDGKFESNVIIQIKNGPIDFQVREPASPLFGGLEKTSRAIELQVTQEYFGQAKHTVFLVPMWKEVLDFDMQAGRAGTPVKSLVRAVVGVANSGMDENWTANHLSQANLYGFGRLAWNPDLSAKTIAEEWTRLTFSNDPLVVKTVTDLLLKSWRVYENYTGVLGLQGLTDIVGNHYGVAVEASERNGWGQWHRADEKGVGMDRTVATGTGFIGQYNAGVARMYESLADCPDDLLLFMHHVPYTHVLHSGKTVIQYIYDSHYEGADAAESYPREWKTLEGRVDDQRYHAVLAQLEYQAGQAQVWRDAVTNWFARASGIPDAKGRVGNYPGRIEAESMRLDGYVAKDVTPWEAASGGKAVECPGARCTALTSYNGPAGRYAIRVQYFDQNTGASEYKVSVAGRAVDEWVADLRVPSRRVDSGASTRRLLPAMELHPGDEIRIEGLPNGTEVAALDYIEILPQPQGAPIYKDPAVPMEQRADDLVSRMTLEEKVSQLMSDSAAIDRLDVPAYNWWNECLHGVARAGRATVFPQPIGLAATWDTDLIHRVASAISDEGRAKYHEFVRRGKRNIYQGLTFWTPNINLFRDPRWGRGMETYGEDPYLTARLAVQFIKGIEGDDPKYLKAVATAKHFAVHSGPEPLRHTFDAVVSEKDLRETYLPHFEAAIKEGGANSVMCAYNRVDGLPACASPQLLENILRKEWGFPGYVVSDCGAIGDVYLNHKTSATPEEGVAASIKAGTDLNCGVEYSNLTAAVRKGLLSESEINRSVRRLLVTRFKLGMFDPPSMVKYAQIPYSVNDSAPHRQLALETARKSIVLLKNEKRTLPLSKSLKTIAVIGPNADNAEVLLGNYNGDPAEPVTPLAGIRKKLPGAHVIYARGADLAANLPSFEVIPSSALSTGGKPGLQGEYYNTSNFDGKLHRPRELTYPSSGRLTGQIPNDLKPVFTRIDPQVDFHWQDGAPRRDMNDDDFGVRWTGYLSAPESGTYQIGALGLNAFEFYFDGRPLFQFNNIHHGSYQYASVELEAGKLYPIRLDYHEYLNDADIQLVWSRARKDQDQQALDAARRADAVVMVLGLSPRLEGEEMKVPVEGFSGGDRIDLGIPRTQQDLLEKVTALGKPVVLVLMNGSALAVNWAKDHVPAIVELWYPGQAGGAALADVLFGDYNPAGRLPVTFYKSAAQLPPFTDYDMKGKTYRFFEGEPLFPFGYGLSYTTFAYSNLKINGLHVSVDVQNTGKLAGEEVVQLYAKGMIRSLAGFQRIPLRAGERRTVEFVVQLAEPGDYEISVGGVTGRLKR